jgi:hypothetical protein
VTGRELVDKAGASAEVESVDSVDPDSVVV